MAGSGKIRVLIVDDIVESRDNVAKLLRFEPDVDIVGMADGGQEGIDLAFQLEPDIVRMDINKFIPRFEIANIYLPPTIFGAGLGSF